MTIWLDAHFSPRLAKWLAEAFSLEAIPVREIGLREAQDTQMFFAARAKAAVVMTKDEDFVHLVRRLGQPPQVIWVTCGNTSNSALFALFSKKLPRTLALIRAGEAIVEIR
ncbi:MAG: DUF5615 family PIN-like protein [Fimbriimonadales bacterium]